MALPSIEATGPRAMLGLVEVPSPGATDGLAPLVAGMLDVAGAFAYLLSVGEGSFFPSTSPP